VGIKEDLANKYGVNSQIENPSQSVNSIPISNSSIKQQLLDKYSQPQTNNPQTVAPTSLNPNGTLKGLNPIKPNTAFNAPITSPNVDKNMVQNTSFGKLNPNSKPVEVPAQNNYPYGAMLDTPSPIANDVGYATGKFSAGAVGMLENPARSILGYAAKAIVGISSLGGLTPNSFSNNENKIANDYLNPDKSVSANLNKNVESQPNFSDAKKVTLGSPNIPILGKVDLSLGNISYGAGSLAGGALIYGAAAKLAEAIPVIGSIASGYSNPVVGKLIQGAVAGTIGMSLVQEPQIVANGLNNKDSFQKISGDVSKDVG
jgi:hypothetical protein